MGVFIGLVVGVVLGAIIGAYAGDDIKSIIKHNRR